MLSYYLLDENVQKICTKYHSNKNDKKVDLIKTKAHRKKTDNRFQLAIKNFTEPVKKTHPTENEKKC